PARAALFPRSLHDALPIYRMADPVRALAKADAARSGPVDPRRDFRDRDARIGFLSHEDRHLPDLVFEPVQAQIHRDGSARQARIDRKSTRLNSSHVKISYA